MQTSQVNNSRLLGLRMQKFQGMILKWIRTYREIFKSALVYLYVPPLKYRIFL